MAEPREGDPTPESSGKSERPEWLVGPDEGLESERETANRPVVQPRLTRPDGSVAPREGGPTPPSPPPSPAGSAPPAPRPRLPDLDDGPMRMSRWTQSVEWARDPEPVAAPAPAAPVEEPSDSWPAPAEPPRPAEREAPLAVESRGPAVPTDSAASRALAAAFHVARRSWKWVAGITAAGLLVVVLVEAAGVGTTAPRDILRHPERFDGQTVRVRGRVSQDVYSIGSGYTFYLLRGRDSLVVFTRTRIPRPGESLELQGEVSTGSVGGVDRPALLEQLR